VVHFSAQIGANDESIPFHLAEVLGQHLLRCLRKQAPQVSAQRRVFLKSAEDADLPFSLD